METTLTCNRCEEVSTSFQTTLGIQLEIVDINLEKCLSKHFSLEKLEDYECQNCKKKTKAAKQYFLAKTPNFLVLVLKKFTQNGKKISDRVKYPFQLDLKKYSLIYAEYPKATQEIQDIFSNQSSSTKARRAPKATTTATPTVQSTPPRTKNSFGSTRTTKSSNNQRWDRYQAETPICYSMRGNDFSYFQLSSPWNRPLVVLDWERDNTGLQLSWQSACLACTRPWVQLPVTPFFNSCL